VARELPAIKPYQRLHREHQEREHKAEYDPADNLVLHFTVTTFRTQFPPFVPVYLLLLLPLSY
jgi:hypothetical protein